KKYGIATPYTSYLVVPDGPMPVVNARPRGRGPGGAFAPTAPMPAGGTLLRGGLGGFGGFGGGGPRGDGAQPRHAAAPKVIEFARSAQSKPGELGAARAKLEDKLTELSERDGKGASKDDRWYYHFEALKEAGEKKKAFDEARQAFALRRADAVQA